MVSLNPEVEVYWLGTVFDRFGRPLSTVKVPRNVPTKQAHAELPKVVSSSPTGLALGVLDIEHLLTEIVLTVDDSHTDGQHDGTNIFPFAVEANTNVNEILLSARPDCQIPPNTP